MMKRLVAIILVMVGLLVIVGGAVAWQDGDGFNPCRSFAVAPIVAVEGEPLVIQWEACAGADRYRVMVLQGSDLVVDEIVTDPYLSIDVPLQAGKQYGGLVAAQNTAGDSFRETIFTPFYPMAAGTRLGSATATVLWNDVPLNNIPVTLGRHCSSNGLIQSGVTDAAGQVIFDRVPPGGYFVRVNYPIRDGAEENTDYTQGCPDQQELLSGESLDFVMHLAKRDLDVHEVDAAIVDTSPMITWESYPDAASYDVTVYPGNEQTTTTTTGVILATLEPWQTYRVMVRAYREDGVPLSEGSTRQFSIQLEGQQPPAPTPIPPPDFSQLEIVGSSPVGVRLDVMQAQPGDTMNLSIGYLECCYFTEIITAYPVVWSVEPADTATIDPTSGILTIAADAPHGASITIIATHDDQTLESTLYIYRPAENPLVGERWFQWSYLNCETGADVYTGDLIGELLFLASGDYYVTWYPFEVYFDYRGTYTYDVTTDNLTLSSPQIINYAPPDFTGNGQAVIDTVGDLLISGIDFGASPLVDVSEFFCGYRFTRDANRVITLTEQPFIIANGTSDGIIYGITTWRSDENYDPLPIPHIPLALYRIEHDGTSAPIDETVSDETGMYRFEDVPSGYYMVLPDAPYVLNYAGYPDALENGVFEQNLAILFDNIALQVDGRTVVWEPYPDADRYRVSLYTAEPYYSGLIINEAVEGTHFTIPDVYRAGRYIVLVRASTSRSTLAQSTIEVVIEE